MSKRTRAERYVGKVLHFYNTFYEVQEVVISAPGDPVLGARGPAASHLCFRVKPIEEENGKLALFKVNSRARYNAIDRERALNENRLGHLWALFGWLKEFVEIQNDIDNAELNRRVASMRTAFSDTNRVPTMETHLRPFAALTRAILVLEHQDSAGRVCRP